MENNSEIKKKILEEIAEKIAVIFVQQLDFVNERSNKTVIINNEEKNHE